MDKDDKFIPKASIGETENTNDKMDRKSFIKWLTIGWLTFAAATGGFFISMVRFLFPNVLFEPPQSFKIGYTEDFEIGKVDLRCIVDRAGPRCLRAKLGPSPNLRNHAL